LWNLCLVSFLFLVLYILLPFTVVQYLPQLCSFLQFLLFSFCVFFIFSTHYSSPTKVNSFHTPKRDKRKHTLKSNKINHSKWWHLGTMEQFGQ
jgi:hypothetical protein